MNVRNRIKALAAALGVLAVAGLACGPAGATNTTFANRAASAVGSQSAGGGNVTRYWTFQLSARRSYHAYAYIGYGPDGGGGFCSVTWLNSAAVAQPNFGGDEEPFDPGSDGDGLLVNTAGEYVVEFTASSTAYCYLRVVETTLFSPWFYRDAGSGYDGFAEIKNTTSSTIGNVVVTAFAPNGTVFGTTTISIPANGTALVTASSLGAFNGGFGSMSIAHPAKPGAITANITTLSNVTGLSFDAPFTTRELVPRY